MKYCPTCETRYDEDILRFCMKDGTPLLDEAEPNFIEMPSDSLEVPQVEIDDPSEVTVIRRNVPVPPPPPPVEPEIEDFTVSEEPQRPSPAQRIVVPTFEERQRQERSRVAAQYQQPPRKSNTALVVFLTMIGTVFVLGIGAAGLWLLQRGGATANSNSNLNANQNANLGLNTSFDFNVNGNFSTPVANSNSNSDFNTNTGTPTPTPRPSATPTASPTATPDDDEPDSTPTPLATRTPIPTPTPIIIRPGSSPTPPTASTPRPTPRVTPRTIITPSNRP